MSPPWTFRAEAGNPFTQNASPAVASWSLSRAQIQNTMRGSTRRAIWFDVSRTNSMKANLASSLAHAATATQFDGNDLDANYAHLSFSVGLRPELFASVLWSPRPEHALAQVHPHVGLITAGAASHPIGTAAQ